MRARLVAFGEIEIEGTLYDRDVVIDGGQVRRRKKGPSKLLREQYGHTPLSVAEDIPWAGKQLIVGTGADGQLPITPEVYEEAARRGITIDPLPTRDACERLAHLKPEDVHAILHITC